MTYKIMVVDDEPANLRILEKLFRRDYHVITADSGLEALKLLEQHDVALLIADQRMPDITGIELLKQTAKIRPHMVRIILTGYTDVSTLVEAINGGFVYRYITKPWKNDELRLSVSRALEHYEAIKARHDLVFANLRLANRLKDMTRGFVRAMADALEARDEHMLGHSRRVSGYSTSIGRRMGLDADMLEQIALAAFLHDIGMIGTPDVVLSKSYDGNQSRPSTEKILSKAAPLSDEERAVVQLHSERGARILADIPEMNYVADVVRHHHENFDGTGYPTGLIGEQIPLASRIILVADAYDSMTSPRPFRSIMTHDEAIEELKRASGTQFDPDVVNAFCELEGITHIRRSIGKGILGGRLMNSNSLRDERSMTFEELKHEVHSQPALAATVMREANTAGYTGDKVRVIAEACDRIGESRLRAIFGQCSAHDIKTEDADLLFRHGNRCAVAAKLLAEHTGVMSQGEAYALGLMHDVGEVLLRCIFPSETEELQWREGDKRTSLELEIFGVDHAQVSGWIIESCDLPRSFSTAVETHHDASKINDPLALLIHLANIIAQSEEGYEASALDELGAERLAILNLTRDDLTHIHSEVRTAMELHMEYARRD
jgi:putative two-component system response regulator